MAAATGNQIAAVDAYIAKAAPFAQPILQHLRELVHAAVPDAPDAQEVIKWSMPFFTYKGIILAHMAAFKAHCSFDIWQEGVKLGSPGAPAQEAGGMGSFGKLTSLRDLPASKE